MDQKYSFDHLPIAIYQLNSEVVEIKRLLLQHIDSQSSKPQDELWTVEQAAEFLNLKMPTIYSKVSRGELPVMKRAGRLYFSKQELLDYLKAGKKKTNAEIAAEAEAYLKEKG